MRWLARGVDALPAGLSWLCPAETARADALRFPKRRTEYLLRRLAGKHAVAAITGVPTTAEWLARIEIANRPDGAPHVMLDGAPAGFGISLTDRAGRAVCLVGDGGGDGGGGLGVGCDLELVEPRSAAFVRDFFTEAEQAYVHACPGIDARHAAANLIWSAKESALKVLRTGLRLDTREVEVTVSTPGPGRTEPGVAGPDGGWRALSVTCPGGVVLPGWWRRDRAFLLTALAPAPGPPPTPLEHPHLSL